MGAVGIVVRDILVAGEARIDLLGGCNALETFAYALFRD